MTSEHISNRYDKELESLRQSVIEMGQMVVIQVEQGLQALSTMDEVLATRVSTSDDKVNQSEMNIDEHCAQILARRQPAAKDLRLIIAIMKITTDLERVGDEAQKLGKYTLELIKKNAKPGEFTDMKHFSQHVVQVLTQSLDAFKNMDLELANVVIDSDEEINQEHDGVLRQLICKMMEDPREIKNHLRVSWAARALERIADHAQNICEYVVYTVNAQDIRHSSSLK